MEKVQKINLPICGRIQHGEQQISNQKRKVVELGYFIAKIRNSNMQFLVNRFNEKYNQKNRITVRFFDEEPFTVRRIRYNQSGPVCYCMANLSEGRQKVSNLWKPINCSEECKYRYAADENSKPMCNLEGTLKFLLPGISEDRIWLMKITGYKSIQRIQAYIEFQKELGNSLIGDYELFLNREMQTSRQGKTFNNCILDIMKTNQIVSNNSTDNTQKNSNNFNQTNITNQNQLSTKSTQNVENKTENTNVTENISDTETKEIKATKKTTRKKKEKTEIETEKQGIKEIEATQVTQEIQTSNDTQNITQEENKNNVQEQNQTSYEDVPIIEDNALSNYYILFNTYNKEFLKDGKPTQYLVGNFVDVNNNSIDVVIPQKYADELSKCDVGTTVILDIAKAGQNYFTNSIKYEQKILKKVAA